MSPRFPAPLKALSVGVLMLAGLATIGAPASAAPSVDFASAWAYGMHTNVSTSWTNGTASYTLVGFFGWDVLFTQTNTSATTVEITAHRAMAVDFALSYCHTPCSGNAATAELVYHAWESENGSVNLTTAGTVYSGGHPLPALAILNASDDLRASVSETWTASLHVLVLDRTVNGSLAVSAQAHLGAEFSPALGLVPEPVSTGEVWNATSAFEAAGSWSATAAYAKVPWNQTLMQGHGTYSGNSSGQGTIVLTGTDSGPLVLGNGATTNGILLGMSGPFVFREGILLLPRDIDAFGGSNAAWSSETNGTAQASTSALDIGGSEPHLGLLASSTAYLSQTPTTTPMGVSPLAVPASAGPDGSGVVQGQPESVAQSQSNLGCLVAGSCAPLSSGGGGARSLGVFGPLVAAVAVLGVVGLVLALAAQRRRVPPPPHPNAALYPPTPTAPPSTPPIGARGAPPPSEEDPLAHLW